MNTLRTHARRTKRARVVAAAACASALCIALAQCGAVDTVPRGTHGSDGATRVKGAASASAAAFDTVYQVLQHPRCVNCHPAGDAPLQGDASLPHAQNVQRGADGQGRYALRCATCHQSANQAGAHMPPGAPNWHLPKPEEPLVFERRGRAELCEQLKSPAHNGGRSLAQLVDHFARDPLVGWGWDPGEGRTSVPIPRDELVRALNTWIDGGCDCPR